MSHMLYGPMPATSAVSMTATATAASTAVTTAVVTQAVVTKAATANSACWHHNAMVGAVWSPVWA